MIIHVYNLKGAPFQSCVRTGVWIGNFAFICLLRIPFFLGGGGRKRISKTALAAIADEENGSVTVVPDKRLRMVEDR